MLRLHVITLPPVPRAHLAACASCVPCRPCPARALPSFPCTPDRPCPCVTRPVPAHPIVPCHRALWHRASALLSHATMSRFEFAITAAPPLRRGLPSAMTSSDPTYFCRPFVPCMNGLPRHD